MAAGLCSPLLTKPRPLWYAAGRRGRELCPQLTFVSGHFKDYQRLGDAAIKVLCDFAPRRTNSHRRGLCRRRGLHPFLRSAGWKLLQRFAGACGRSRAPDLVLGLTKVASADVACLGVRVNAVCPGPVETRMIRSLESQRNPADTRVVHDANSASTPTGRYATPGEVANVVMCLCSDLASDTLVRISSSMGPLWIGWCTIWRASLIRH